MRVARRYLITGRVQGVGFRFFTQAAATREGVHGWVRNLSEGLAEAVEAVAEGDAEAIERFERSIRQGPRGARVDRVEVDVIVPDGRAVGFIIK
jgi:acylphosphatase